MFTTGNQQKKTFRWKNRNVSEKVYHHLLKKSENGKKRKLEKSEVEESGDIPEGIRHVDFQVMAKHMHCQKCNDKLFINNCEKEKRQGLGSFLIIRCTTCFFETSVPTSKYQEATTNRQKMFDINANCALGAIHTGIGLTQLQKFMAAINVPPMSQPLYKRHERIVGNAIEVVAKESCLEAAKEERQLTIDNVEELKKLLPDDVPEDFLTPQSVSNTPDAMDQVLTNELNGVVSFWSVVRVVVSYDMGWSKRDTGKQYDSLNGYGTIIGHQTGRVLDYTTRNRKCKACDVGVPVENHDCRLNFYGSAKGMEPDAAVQLMAKSEILKQANLEVGIFVGDNDSSSIAAIRNACGHHVIKLSDKNHTSKGVTNALYTIQSKGKMKELTSEAIKYLHRNVTYAMAQNKGNSKNMAAAIRNIPYHSYNKHDNCGDWCGFKKDPEHYNHSTIPNGFKCPRLFDALKKLFDRLADNAHSYSAGLSTNINESLNSSMASKCPKRICYSMSASADHRFAAVVAQRNLGEKYLQEVQKNINISPGKHLIEHARKCDDLVAKRRLLCNTHNAKLTRLRRKQTRQQLRYNKENQEGITYQSHVGLFGDAAGDTADNLANDTVDDEAGDTADNLANDTLDDEAGDTADNLASDTLDDIAGDTADNTFHETTIDTLDDASDVSSSKEKNKRPIIFKNKCIIFFDLETSGFGMDCDILQVAMRSGDFSCDAYIQPAQPINPKASEVNGLTKQGKELFFNGKRVVADPAWKVLQHIYGFLKSFNMPCILIAHNCSFDAPRLSKMIIKNSRVEDFKKIIAGFVDTLPLFRKKYPDRKNKGECSLTTLVADTLSITTQGAHNAVHDVIMLQELCVKHFTAEELVSDCTSMLAVVEKLEKLELKKKCIATLEPLQSVVSKNMIDRIASANISYNLLIDTYCNEGWEKTRMLLQQKVDGTCQIIKRPAILNDIHDFLSELLDKPNDIDLLDVN